MARIKKERIGKEKILQKRKKCYISHPCSEGLNDAIFTKFGKIVDLTYIMTFANFDCNRLEGGGTLRLHKIYLFPMTSMVGLTTGKH